MIGEIAVVPQTEGPAREIVASAIEEIGRRGLRYQVEATGTSVEGALDEILAALRAIETRLRRDGVERALIELRLQLEPHRETLEHQVEGLADASRTVAGRSDGGQTLGLSEHELRDGFEEELILAMRAEGGRPTVHAFAHSVARVLEQDHLRMAEQLENAGLPLPASRHA